MQFPRNSKGGSPLIRISVVLIGLICALSSTAPAQQNPVPLINQPLVPTVASPGGADFILTLNGTGFASGAVVNWNGGGTERNRDLAQRWLEPARRTPAGSTQPRTAQTLP